MGNPRNQKKRRKKSEELLQAIFTTSKMHPFVREFINSFFFFTAWNASNDTFVRCATMIVCAAAFNFNMFPHADVVAAIESKDVNMDALFSFITHCAGCYAAKFVANM